MSKIKIPDAERQIAVEKIQKYFNAELDQEIGRFDAQFLLEFFAKEIGAVFYNQGLYDAQNAFKDKLDTLADSVLDLEKPVG